MSRFILVIDQGTTSTRALIFDQKMHKIAFSQQEFRQFFPQSGWVEHDAEEIWQTTLSCCKQAIDLAGIDIKDLAGIGITNQRETTVIWDRRSGKPIYKAIVWQDRRTAADCQFLKDNGAEQVLLQKTGLILDPYFSATKIKWILENIPGARLQAEQGSLAFGTIDSFLLWRFTGGKCHYTDAANAARTSLFNIHSQQWDEELLALFNVPRSLMPEVLDNVADFGTTDKSIFNHEIPILAMAGDQQAALIGQACFEPGQVKCTYGTGAFLVLNTGNQPLRSKHRLLSTIGYRLNGKVTYALEGSIFSAGTIVQWLRDKLKLINKSKESEDLAKSVTDNGGVILIPAFTGLGAPYWRPDVKASLLGLTRDSSAAHIVRAGLEAVAYQTKDLITAMREDGANIHELRVDGGMAANEWLMSFTANLLQLNIKRSALIETTALGVAFLAGLGAGIFNSLDEAKDLAQSDCSFIPQEGDISIYEKYYENWRDEINNVNSR